MKAKKSISKDISTKRLDSIPELSEMIDINELKVLLNDFYIMTGLGTSVIDNHGKVLVGIGRQRICRDFHWKNSACFSNCRESDIRLTKGLQAGKFNIIKCKNNIWDIATPLTVEDIHVGNLFIGQFLFDEEPVDEAVFRKQAEEFGFEEKDYLEALIEVPRISRQSVTNAMNLMVGFANMISCQGLNNLRIARSLKEKEDILRELQTSRGRFKTTIYNIAEAVVTVGATGVIEQMNRVAEQLTGWKEIDAVGKKIDEVINLTGNNGDNEKNAIGGLLEGLDNLSPSKLQILVSRTGKKIPISFSASDIAGSNSEKSGWVLVFADQTGEWEKQKASKAREERILRQRQALARLSVEESINSGEILAAKKILVKVATETIRTGRISIWLFSDDETVFECIELNESAEEMPSADAKLDPAKFRRYFEILKRESRINSTDSLNDLRLIELRDNYLVPLGITSLMDAGIFVEGRLAGVFSFEQVGERREWYADEESFVSTISTLTAQVLINAKRTKTQKELKESLMQNQALIDSIPDLVFLFNRNGVFLNFHSPSLNSLYVKPEQFLNKSVDEALPGYLARLTRENLDRLFSTGRPQIYEYEMEDEGITRYFDSRMVLCGSDKAMTIVREITDQKIIQKELLLAKEKAEESDKLKSAFLANMSHEIRTPMNSIIGFSSLLQERRLEEDKKVKYLDIITTNADHLLRLIDDIIDISKIESGDIELHHEPVDIQQLFEEILKMFYDRKPWVQIRFISGSLPLVLCDRVKLAQILANLVGNAIKFTNQGYVEYSVTVDNDFLVFSVEDTGPGIPESQKDEIFNRFSQGDHASATSRGGTGLGLAIAKAYIEKLGGSVWLESLPGKGTTFFFSVPYIPTEKDIKRIVKQEEIKGRRLNLLVAEDDILNFLFIEEIFAGMDVNIKHAKNGKEAVKLCRTEQFDLVLMDIKMPVMNGLDAIRKIKSINPNLPVIAVSAHAFWSEQEKAFREGCDDYITKPLRPDELKRKINNLVQFMVD